MNIKRPKIVREPEAATYGSIREDEDQIFDGVEIIDASFSDTGLTRLISYGSVIKDSDLSGNVFDGADLTDTCFINCDFSNTTFDKASIHRVEFINCKMTGVNFDASIMKHIKFQQAILNLSTMNESKLENILFAESRLITADFFNDKFKNEDNELKKKLKLAEKKLKKIEEEDDSFSRDFEMGQWALRYLEVSKSLNKDRSLIETFMKDYSYLSEVREYYVSECMENGEYDKAVQLLEEGKNADEKLPGLVNRYSGKLKDIYRLQGKEDAYLKELWALNLSKAGDVSLFNELKALYNEDEWTEKRELIFEKANSHYAGKDDLFINEGLYDRLLDFAVKTAGTHMVQKHHDVLLEKYPEAVLNKYEMEIENMAARASNRKNYWTVVNSLRGMRELPGGEDRVNALAEKWKEKYKQRPAMMDELAKL